MEVSRVIQLQLGPLNETDAALGEAAGGERDRRGQQNGVHVGYLPTTCLGSLANTRRSRRHNNSTAATPTAPNPNIQKSMRNSTARCRNSLVKGIESRAMKIAATVRIRP